MELLRKRRPKAAQPSPKALHIGSGAQAKDPAAIGPDVHVKETGPFGRDFAAVQGQKSRGW
jgi:hypothetical protein